MILSDFRTAFPEMNGVSDALVSAKLAAAALEIDTGVWGGYGSTGALTLADQGQAYLCAHKLATSPFGQNARMVIKDRMGYESTTYGQEYYKMIRIVSSGFRVTI